MHLDFNVKARIIVENDLNIIIKDGNTTQHIDANELIADY